MSNATTHPPRFNGTPLPRYRCHKEVSALKINEYVVNPNGSIDLFFEESGFKPLNMEGDWVSRFKPTPHDCGYYVMYDDGYASWSPSPAFESGYSPA